MIEEEKLTKRAINGKAEAFGDLYDHYQPKIYRFIYLKVSHKQEAEDLTHQVFLSAWENIPAFKIKKENSFQRWIYSIARNKVIDHYRTKKPAIDIENIVEPAETKDYAGEIDTAIEIEKVRRALPRLKEIEQEVVIMRFVEEMAVKEVAEILGKSETAIKLIQHRAIKNLRKILNNGGQTA